MYQLNVLWETIVKYVGEGAGGFCEDHEIFEAYIDRPWNIFQNF